MQADIAIESKQGNKKITTTITYVNPNVPNNKLSTLAVALNNLTTNEYTKATRITRGEVL